MIASIPTDELVDDLLTSVAFVLQASGLPLEQTLASLSRKLEALSRSPSLGEGDAQAVSVIGHALTLWRDSPEYCDDNGDPLDLPKDGSSPSLKTLLSTAASRRGEHDFGDETFEAFFALMLSYGAITSSSDESYSRSTPYLPLTSSQTSDGRRIVLTAADFLRTLRNNVSAPLDPDAPHDKLFQRATLNVIPEQCIPLLSAELHSRGATFLEDIDSMASSFEDGESESQVYSGVGVYMFRLG